MLLANSLIIHESCQDKREREKDTKKKDVKSSKNLLSFSFHNGVDLTSRWKAFL